MNSDEVFLHRAKSLEDSRVVTKASRQIATKCVGLYLTEHSYTFLPYDKIAGKVVCRGI